ncbi:IPT/TIG domain-containing protein [Kribbella sp. VKM Ac-2527]|uniref:IPT/TIG domain-containing protein n=1 Tax=Kribbella caucasensis TaxID=2512215 RepID=A0A4R6KB38_9ACTN|nr:IPT/TIG domain-containing protein [Kribbella sp. VKM Ac-2527]TDO47146.1 IPT/TIG domain-containing protein [Kribbella sp. VKM Ac-2527]
MSHWAAERLAPKSLSITPTPFTIAKGDTKAVLVWGTYPDGSTRDASKLVTLTSDNPSVATIDDFTVKAVAVGQAHIAAMLTANHSIAVVLTVAVGPAVPRSLAIAPASPLLVVGKNLQLAATVTYTDGTTLSTTSWSTWSSGNTAAATASAKGSLRGVAVGIASISATYKDPRSPGIVTRSTIATVLSGPPQVTGFTPTSGPVGTPVTIQGADLLGDISVEFGGVSAQFTPNSSSSETAIVPAGARTGAISITSSLGTARSKNKFTVR